MTTATATWPTLEELRAISDEFNQTLESLEGLRYRLRALADVDAAPSVREGQPRPSLADVGALTWAIEAFGLELEVVRDYIGDVRRIRDLIALHDVKELDDAS